MPIKEVESWGEAFAAFKTGNLYTKKEKYPVLKPTPKHLSGYVILTHPEKDWYDELNNIHFYAVKIESSK